jgi:outer membrane protein TolC
MMQSILAGLVVLLMASGAGAQTPAAAGQTPQPVARLTFREAVDRATERNPSSAIAAAAILRAAALVDQVRSGAGLQINGNATSTTINRGIEFEGTTVTPRSSVTAGLDVRYPLYSPVLWARRVEAQDNVAIAELSAAETKRQTALATADAYLAIIARRRVVDANIRARDAARAHAELARELEAAGTGSRLNRLRAEQELSIDEGLIENARLALYRAQEALGVLVVANGPVDAADEPTFELPPAGQAGTVLMRSDLQLFAAQQRAAERLVADNRKSYFPTLQAVFQPSATYPSQFFTPTASWRALLQFDVPIFDNGGRAAERRIRQTAVDTLKAQIAARTTEIASAERAAREAVASAERELVSVRAAAAQAEEVVTIVNISFRAGAATNIEVIDAERRARDADTSVAVSEDALRRARFDLLNALGRFP